MAFTRRLLWFALIATIAPAAVAGTVGPLQLQDNGFPTLAASPERSGLVAFNTTPGEFPHNCQQLRIATLDEIAPRWRGHLHKPVLDECRSAPPGTTATDSGKAGIATATWYSAHAAVKPGTVTLHGLPVLAVREAQTELYGSRTLVLGVPLRQALAVLRPLIEHRCGAAARANPSIPGNCVMQREDDGSWAITVGELNSSIRLSSDPGHHERTLHTVAGGD